LLLQNQELRAVLAGSWPDLGLTPERCSAGYYLTAYGSYLEGEQSLPQLEPAKPVLSTGHGTQGAGVMLLLLL
jgi:hypothetical protein